MSKQRVFLFDNMKYILICLVVAGHFIGEFTDVDTTMKVIWRWIYLFHMPAFIFIGGIFAKRIYTAEKGLRINTVAFYLAMGFLLYVSLWFVRRSYDPGAKFDLINMGSIPWYFFALAAFAASLPLVAKVRGGAKTVIPLSVALAVAAGFVDGFDDFLVLGRIATYAPFYFAGYFIDARQYAGWVSGIRSRKIGIVGAIAVMALLFVALVVLPKSLTGTMATLATGHNPYSTSNNFPSYIDAGVRLLDFAVAVAMIVALSVLTPDKHLFFTEWGAATLQVYFWHPFIYYPVIGFGLLEPLMPWGGAVAFVVGVLIATILAVPKWLGKPFILLKNAIKVDIEDARPVSE